MQKTERNAHMDSILKMIHHDKERSEVLSNRYQTACYALKLDGLECGIWFSEHDAGVFGTIVTEPLISSYWDANADAIERFINEAESFKDKAEHVVAILMHFYQMVELMSDGCAEEPYDTMIEEN